MVVPCTAAADTMDPALARLVTNKGCRTVGAGGGVYYNPQSGFTPCSLDNAAFAKLVAQYGVAIAPTAMHSARTTGYGGFELAIEGAYSTIDNKADYWINGTQGPQEPTTKNFSVRNKEPPGMMQLYTFKIRKGFPFGIELTGNFGYLAQTSIYTLGADVRWSLFEGFRTGIPAIFPELSVGGSVRTITGTDQFQLTVVGVDGQLSKPIPIAGTTVLTPWIGYQFLRIFGDSGLIDLTPNTDAVNTCGFSGTNTPANKDPSKTYADGQPVCAKNGSSADFNNTAVFAPARLNRHRIVAGLQLRVQMVMFGGQFMYDVVDPGDANKPSSGENIYKDVKRQMTLAFDLGAVF
ncbi:Hypothetical protein A7982_04738 [Minicystis rosea]|nr:Hypothetical protein A7982_04738 [Minicystis rosea]